MGYAYITIPLNKLDLHKPGENEISLNQRLKDKIPILKTQWNAPPLDNGKNYNILAHPHNLRLRQVYRD